MEAEIARKKAELINASSIFISKEILLPHPLSKSTTGPGAGIPGICLGFANTRIKMGVKKDEGTRFSLVPGNPYTILDNDQIFLENVDIIPTLLHAPEQGFVNISSECIYNCIFCTTPQLEARYHKSRTDEQIVELIMKASEKPSFHSVAITSGVEKSINYTVNRMVNIVSQVHEKLPNTPIGVEPYATTKDDMMRLREAGASEFKLNIESFDREIFQKICPELYYDGILSGLEDAVEIFGAGKVCSNIIFGLGETDENIIAGIEKLASMGVVVSLRAVRINEYNKELLAQELGITKRPEPERMIRLAQLQNDILAKYDLSTKTFDTMCHRCKCCDIEGF